jgi:2,3-bisphosphoglycerate-dependent phosphoglycerate mutase
MTTRVLLLRHAESADHSIFHGAESDIDLSERGRRQAEAVAGLIAAYRPHHVISSAMRRARATAAPIARACNLPIQIEPDLHERRVGALSGTPTGLREGAWPETLQRWLAGETGYAPPGAESLDQVQERVLAVWQRVTEKALDSTLVVVAHGLVSRVLLLSILTGWSIADWKRLGPIHNVAITELLRTDRGWHALRLNEIPEAVNAVH